MQDKNNYFYDEMYKVILDEKNTNIKEILNNMSFSGNDINAFSSFTLENMSCIIGVTKSLFEGFKELHHHDFNEILYIKKGTFKFKVDDKIYKLEPGDLVIVTPSTLHVLEQTPNMDCEKIVINVTDDYITQFNTKNTNLRLVLDRVNETKNYCIRFRNQVKHKLEKYLNNLIESQFSKKYGEDLFFKIKFVQLMILINANYEQVQEIKIDTEHSIISKAVEFINNNISKSFNIDDIANYLNVSPSTISHTFKSQTGVSLYKFITKKRMILAKTLIKQRLTFNEVYLQCGFNDYTSFFRAFKKEFNTTPKDFQLSYFNMIKE